MMITAVLWFDGPLDCERLRRWCASGWWSATRASGSAWCPGRWARRTGRTRRTSTWTRTCPRCGAATGGRAALEALVGSGWACRWSARGPCGSSTSWRARRGRRAAGAPAPLHRGWHRARAGAAVAHGRGGRTREEGAAAGAARGGPRASASGCRGAARGARGGWRGRRARRCARARSWWRSPSSRATWCARARGARRRWGSCSRCRPTPARPCGAAGRGEARRVVGAGVAGAGEGRGPALGGTVNDVLLTAVTGALRRYLEARDAPLEDVHALVPVNLRPLDEPMPRELGNRFGAGVPAPARAPGGPPPSAPRAGEADGGPEALTRGGGDASARWRCWGARPCRAGAHHRGRDGRARRRSSPPTCPGPASRCPWRARSWRGSRSGCRRPDTLGLGVSLFSYAGQVTVGVASDAERVPDPGAIVAAFQDELDALASRGSLSPLQAARAPPACCRACAG